MSAPVDLAALVAAADPAALLPGRHRAEAERITTPLRLRDSVDLGGDVLLLVTEDAGGTRYPVPAVLDEDRLRRALPGDGAGLALVAALAERGASPADLGGAGCTFVSWRTAAVAHEQAIDVDQSNESVIVAADDGAEDGSESAVVKWTVRSTAGPHPAPARLERLVAAGFEAMPHPWGLVLWTPAPGEPPELVATVATLVPGARDGWDWAVEDVRALARGADPGAAEAAPARLGAIVAAMHLALADPEPTRADTATARRWRDDALAGLAEARQVIDGAEGARLERHADAVADALASLGDAAGTPLIPIHGDLHVGQVLRGADGALKITDFDGNPVASGPERVAPQPAAVDVASMLQSLDHVAYVVLHRTTGVDEATVTAWQERAQADFLAAYRTALADAGRADLLDERLLEPLRLRQVCREYVYAGRHLPHWRYVPDRAVAARFGEPPPPAGLGASTTPPAGRGASTTPPAGRGASTTPPAGRGASTTPPAGLGASTTPPAGLGASTAPPAGRGASGASDRDPDPDPEEPR